MLVSVVIGALNEEKYIGATLKTLKGQLTDAKFEIIVGDGFSEDSTVKIAKKFGARVAKEKKRSAAWERMAGARIARGEIIAFTDADARVPRDWVEKIAFEFERDKSLAMVYGPVYFSDSTGFERELSVFVMNVFLRLSSLLGLHNPIGSNIAVRRALFEECGGFNTMLVTAEDLDIAKRMKKFGGVKFAPKIFVDVSARRVKKWGYVHYIFYHLLNALRFHTTGASRSDYDPVR